MIPLATGVSSRNLALTFLDMSVYKNGCRALCLDFYVPIMRQPLAFQLQLPPHVDDSLKVFRSAA